VEVKHIARLGAAWDDCRDPVPAGDPAVAMGYWDVEDLPFYAGLAQTFPLADRQFTSDYLSVLGAVGAT